MTQPTKYESAKLILELYDLRREEKMRESRTWWWFFNPQNPQEYFEAMNGPDSAKLRQSMGYWEMAAALVNHGAIDAAMFNDTNGEFLFMYAKLEPMLAEIRKGDPTTLIQVEKMIKNTPGHEQTIAHIKGVLAKWAK